MPDDSDDAETETEIAGESELPDVSIDDDAETETETQARGRGDPSIIDKARAHATGPRTDPEDWRDYETDDGGINYSAVPIPDPAEKPRSEWDYPERRAEIYRMIEQKGHPRNIEYSQRQLAERYDRNHRTIWNDIQKLKEYEQTRIGEYEESSTAFLAQRAIQDALTKDDYEKAFKLQLEYYEWLFDSGSKQKAAEQHNVDVEAVTAWRRLMGFDDE